MKTNQMALHKNASSRMVGRVSTIKSKAKESIKEQLYSYLIGILLIINSCTIYQLLAEHSQKKEVTYQKEALQLKFKDLSDSLFVRSNELEQLKGRNSELNQALIEKKNYLEKEKKEIQKMLRKSKLSSAELRKIKSKIAHYQAFIYDLETDISGLAEQREE